MDSRDSFTSGATPTDRLATSMATEPFRPMYLHTYKCEDQIRYGQGVSMMLAAQSWTDLLWNVYAISKEIGQHNHSYTGYVQI